MMMSSQNHFYNFSVKAACGVAVGLLAATAFVFAAAVFDPVSQPIWTAPPFALKNSNLELGDTKAYRAWFENGAWQGDIIEYVIKQDGERVTDASIGTNPPVAGVTNWSARATFVAQEAAITDYWKAGRKIIRYNGVQQSAFLWSNLSSTERAFIDSATAADTSKTSAYDSSVLNFVRGDRSNEFSAGLMRKRYSLLGDIVGSHPVYVGAPSGLYFNRPGYATFYGGHDNRAGRLYVGANDGLIHVFDAQDGREVYAYAPTMLFSKLSRLTAIPYIHNFYADGELVVSDAIISGTWATVLAGGLGAGARGLFALDISNPDLTSETSNTGADKKILWEKSGADATMGHVYGRPKIAQLPDGKWYVVSGNGYGSTSGIASLEMIEIGTGAGSSISTGVGGSNGLSAATLVDTDGDSVADYAYAGDLLGNLWKFTLKSPRSVFRLFAAGNTKPITTAPELGRHPQGGYLVYFGTGSLLSETDASDLDVQTVYAIWDKPGNTSIVTDITLQPQMLSAASHASGGEVRISTAYSVDWKTRNGWKVDFPVAGERLLGRPQLRAGRLQFVSTEPSKNSWLMGLDWLTGGDSRLVIFDLDGNGVLDAADKVIATVDGSLASYLPVATELGISNYSQPAIARISAGIDALYINGLTLPISTPPEESPTGCTGDCPGGIAGGHIDVDTDTVLGGSTDAHSHEYDDIYNVTYVDYLDLRADKLQSVVDSPPAIPGNKKWLVILANADFSPGGELAIGDKKWNVVDYQEMVQRKLGSWDGVDLATLLDDAGDPLTYSLDDVQGSTESLLQITFNSLSIQGGGVHPTQTGCVKTELNLYNGRWRNGALTIHWLDAGQLKAGGASDNIYIAQNPADLVEGMVGGGLHANPANDSGFLLESTLFWHFGDYSTKCYGDPGWEDDRDAALGVPTATDTLPELRAELAELQGQIDAYVCARFDKKSKCKDAAYKNLVNQYNLIAGLIDSFPTSSPPGSTVVVPAIPIDVLDTAAEFLPSPGTAGHVGRYSWIDVE